MAFAQPVAFKQHSEQQREAAQRDEHRHVEAWAQGNANDSEMEVSWVETMAAATS